METEIWKPVVGYEGLYEVSNLGNVRSLYDGGHCHKKYRIRILKKELTNTGYLRVTLYNEGKSKRKGIHRLVAFAFHGNPNNYPVVMHLDNNRINNNSNNLRWGTYEENIRQCYDEGRANNHFQKNNPRTMLGKFGKEHHLSKPIIQYDKFMVFVKEFNGISDASRITGISYSNISKCCNGKAKTAGGFIWKHKN